MNETNLAQHFKKFFNSIYLSANYLMKSFICCFSCYIFILYTQNMHIYIYIYIKCIYIYIYSIYIGAIQSQSYQFKECRVGKPNLVRADNPYKVHCPLFLPSSPLNLQTVQVSPFLGNSPLYIVFLCAHPSSEPK